MMFVRKGAAQRFALAAGGRAGIRFERRKKPKPEKCLKTAQSPTSRLHALLARRLQSYYYGGLDQITSGSPPVGVLVSQGALFTKKHTSDSVVIGLTSEKLRA